MFRALYYTVAEKAQTALKTTLKAVQFTISRIVGYLLYAVQHLRRRDSAADLPIAPLHHDIYFWVGVLIELLIAAVAIKMNNSRIFLLLAWPVGAFVAHLLIERLRLERWIIIPCIALIGCGLWLFDMLLNPVIYVYLLPGRGLCANYAQAPPESLPRRVFVVQQEGKGVLHNVEIVLHDNHQKDQTAIDHVEQYAEVDSKESGLKGVQPKHVKSQGNSPPQGRR
jgi:hypothetical protein